MGQPKLPTPPTLTGHQVAEQQVQRAQLLKKYPDVHPSSYAPIVEDASGTTFRFYVRKGEALVELTTLVEVRVKKKGGR